MKVCCDSLTAAAISLSNAFNNCKPSLHKCCKLKARTTDAEVVGSHLIFFGTRTRPTSYHQRKCIDRTARFLRSRCFRSLFKDLTVFWTHIWCMCSSGTWLWIEFAFLKVLVFCP